MMSEKRDYLALRNGIFVQQTFAYRGADHRWIEGYCVTFPRIDDSGKECLFPTEVKRTFSQALAVARMFKATDSRLKRTPIFCLQQSWRKGYRATRILQEVEQ